MREIVTDTYIDEFKKNNPKATPPTRDEYSDKVLKLIPAEVVALYLTVTGLAEAANLIAVTNYNLWIIFAVGFIAVFYQLLVKEKVKNNLQVGIAAIAFIVWVYTVGGPFKLYLPGLYNQAVGAILLVVFTFFVPTTVN